MSAIHSSRQVSACCSEHHDALVSSNLAISPVSGEIRRLHWWHAAPYPIGVSPSLLVNYLQLLIHSPWKALPIR
ncbi:Hypothetical Protein CGB_B4230W [Cryptococcus gattii WM276]|uniref:Uncharacterized protein n=1 Tax=Cryptococcus gattii serotype B (strain WM276 / ATCC MYA-4071) TaxID=367775 RepID=E6R0Q2_CRYGW|nr:Hypothetical Protein CGB_B4230W [Cryptococcus gattii WM276]ADV20393.1 Hypothetical Protein CGB_B4230W [Cryptococcus gattii WM276]